MVNGQIGRVSYAPIGVVYGIQPWNYPSYQVVRYSIACLMGGNAVLLKHGSNVTGSGKLLESIYRKADIPDGLFTNLVISHDQSDEVIKHKLVRGVTFTGGPEIGSHIGQIASAELKKTVLELGANDSYLVFEDADIDEAVIACVKGRIYNNGETCIAAKRFIATEKVYDEFREKFVKAMSAVKMGDPNDESTELGPLAREDLRDDLHEQVVKSVENGAKILFVSGVAITFTDLHSYLENPRFLMKMTVVGVIALNGVVLNLYVAPKMELISLREEDRESNQTLVKVSFIVGAVSAISWLTAFFLAMIEILETFSYITLLVAYLLLLVIAINGGLFTKHRYEKSAMEG